MVRDLSEALERAQEESRRSRVLGELGGTIDLEEVVTRTLDAAGTMRGVDAVVVSVGAGGEAFTAASGLGHGEPASAIAGPPDGSQPRSIAVEYDYGPGEPADSATIRAGLAVPLANQGEQLGYVSAYSQSRPRRLRPVGRRGARGARAPRRAGARQRPPLSRGPPARRSRRAHRPAQPALLPRDARPRGRARAALQPQPRARRLRPRRLQGDQRPDRPPRRRRRPRRGGRPDPRRRPLGGRRLPGRRRRVRGDPAGVVAEGRGSALQAAGAGDLDPAGGAGRAGCISRPASPSCARTTTRSRSSSGPTRRSTAPRAPARRHRRGRRGAYAAAATGARNGIQLVSGTAPIVGRRSRIQRISSSARSWLRSAQAA